MNKLKLIVVISALLSSQVMALDTNYTNVSELKSFTTHNDIYLGSIRHTCTGTASTAQFYLQKDKPQMFALAVAAYTNNKLVRLHYECDDELKKAVVTGVRVKNAPVEEPPTEPLSNRD